MPDLKFDLVIKLIHYFNVFGKTLCNYKISNEHYFIVYMWTTESEQFGEN